MFYSLIQGGNRDRVSMNSLRTFRIQWGWPGCLRTAPPLTVLCWLIWKRKSSFTRSAALFGLIPFWEGARNSCQTRSIVSVRCPLGWGGGPSGWRAGENIGILWTSSVRGSPGGGRRARAWPDQPSVWSLWSRLKSTLVSLNQLRNG